MKKDDDEPTKENLELHPFQALRLQMFLCLPFLGLESSCFLSLDFFSFHRHLIKHSCLASPSASGQIPPCGSLMKISDSFLSGYRIHVSLDFDYYSKVSVRHQTLLLCPLLLWQFYGLTQLQIGQYLQSMDSVYLGC